MNTCKNLLGLDLHLLVNSLPLDEYVVSKYKNKQNLSKLTNMLFTNAIAYLVHPSHEMVLDVLAVFHPIQLVSCTPLLQHFRLNQGYVGVPRMVGLFQNVYVRRNTLLEKIRNLAENVQFLHLLLGVDHIHHATASLTLHTVQRP